MDFIAIDLDRYDVLEAFRQPVPVKAQMYLKTANWNPGSPSEEVDCDTDNPADGCFQDDQQPSQQTIGQASGFMDTQGGGTNTYTEPGQENHGLGGLGGLTEEQMACGREQNAESEIDATAREAAAEIMSRSDWRRREYGAFIYSGPNGVRLGEIFRGDSDSVDIIARPRAGESIVGRIHNHPRGSIGAPSDVDIDGVNELISHGLVDSDDFSDYILDGNRRNPETNLSEFDEPQNGTSDRPNNDTRADARGDCSNV